MTNEMNRSGRRNFGSVNNGAISRGNFLRTASMVGGAVAAAGLGWGGVGVAKAQTVQNTLNVPSQYPTIQAAIDAANPGDTIMVAAGNYDGAVINKPVAIIGLDGTCITGAIEKSPHGAIAGFMIPVGHGADGAQIINFSFDGIPLPVWARGADNITVSYLNISNCAQGITNNAGKGWTITHNTITNFALSDSLVAFGYEAIGIEIMAHKSYDRNAVVENLVIAYNEISSAILNPSVPCLGIEMYVWPRNISAPMINNQIYHNKVHVTGGLVEETAGIALIDESQSGMYDAKIAGAAGVNNIKDPLITDNTVTNNDCRHPEGSDSYEIVLFPPELMDYNTFDGNWGAIWGINLKHKNYIFTKISGGRDRKIM